MVEIEGLAETKEALIEKLREVISLSNFSVKPLYSKVWLEVHPAIDRIGNVSYVGVDLPCEVTDRNGKTQLKEFHFLVTSDRRKILCHREVLNEKKIRLKHSVVRVPMRWSPQSVEAWLNGHVEVEPQELYIAVKTMFETYIEFEDSTVYDFLTLWTIGTYFFHLFNTYPYLYIHGMKRTGKTKLLTVLSLQSYNAIFSGNISTSSVFRLVQSGRCTLLIDETEKLSNPERALDFRNLLLNGYKKGALVYRTHKDTLKPEPFEVYSPKAVANIRGLEDVLEDRCITLIMKRGKKRDILNSEPQLNSKVWQDIRDKLYTFYLECSGVICELSAVCEVPGEGLSERSLELWKPILTLAKFFDSYFEGLYDKILDFAIKKTEEKNVENMTEVGEYILVQTLLNLVKENRYYKVKTVKEAMVQNFDEEQKWLNSRWVGRALRRLGFTEKRRVGMGTEYLFHVSQVKDLAERLGIKAEKTPSPVSSQITLSSQTTLKPSILEVYKALRKQFKEPFYENKAIELICKLRNCDYEEARKLWGVFVDEGKAFRDPYGLWVWG